MRGGSWKGLSTLLLLAPSPPATTCTHTSLPSPSPPSPKAFTSLLGLQLAKPEDLDPDTLRNPPFPRYTPALSELSVQQLRPYFLNRTYTDTDVSYLTSWRARELLGRDRQRRPDVGEGMRAGARTSHPMWAHATCALPSPKCPPPRNPAHFLPSGGLPGLLLRHAPCGAGGRPAHLQPGVPAAVPGGVRAAAGAGGGGLGWGTWVEGLAGGGGFVPWVWVRLGLCLTTPMAPSFKLVSQSHYLNGAAIACNCRFCLCFASLAWFGLVWAGIYNPPPLLPLPAATW